jgi:hypothetical protein
MFRLPRGGSKESLVQTLLDSEYSPPEVIGPASELAIGILVEDFVPKSLWSEILRENRMASSGPRHELLLRLIENRIFSPRETLAALSPDQLRETYYRLFERVPTADAELAISEILDAFGAPHTEDTSRKPARMSSKSAPETQYDIALSFAGEDRPTAREIGDKLRKRGVRVFLDEYERTALWGKDLSVELSSRYGERTRYVVLLVSRHYPVKDWTDFEFTVAKKEAGRRGTEFILPVRLDDTPLPGLHRTIAYLDLKELGVDAIVEEILRKLGVD